MKSRATYPIKALTYLQPLISFLSFSLFSLTNSLSQIALRKWVSIYILSLFCLLSNKSRSLSLTHTLTHSLTLTQPTTMGRSPCCDKEHINKGTWSREEDLCLSNYIKANGEGNWRALPKAAGIYTFVTCFFERNIHNMFESGFFL